MQGLADETGDVNAMLKGNQPIGDRVCHETVILYFAYNLGCRLSGNSSLIKMVSHGACLDNATKIGEATLV